MSKNIKKYDRSVKAAVKSHDPTKFAALLQNPTINIDRRLYSETALHQLIIALTDANFKQIFECIRLLIEHNANVNISGSKELPIMTLIKHVNVDVDYRFEMIRYLLEKGNVDLDLNDGEARTCLMACPEHNLQLPAVMNPDDRCWSLTRLFEALRNKDAEGFRFGFAKFVADPINSNGKIKSYLRERQNGRTMLSIAVSQRMVGAVEQLLRAGADVKDYCKTDCGVEWTAIRSACINGQYTILKMLLRAGADVNRSPVLIDVIVKIGDQVQGNVSSSTNYNHCYDMLIKLKHIDLNLQDNLGQTALHTAIRCNHPQIVKELLRRGVNMGKMDLYNRAAIDDISPILLESHLDSCIRPNCQPCDEKNYAIKFDYTNLAPDLYDQEYSKYNQFDEMNAIEYLANSLEHKHLIKHPLISSFLHLKWHRLAPVFLIHFMVYFISGMSLVWYIYQENSDPLREYAYMYAMVGVFLLSVREFLQISMCPKQYFRNYENYFEQLLVMLAIAVLHGYDFTEDSRRFIALFTTLMVVGEFCHWTGSLPILSKYLVTLFHMTKGFVCCLQIYSIVLIAIALGSRRMAKDYNPNNSKSVIVDEEAATYSVVIMFTNRLDEIMLKINSLSILIALFFVFMLCSLICIWLSGQTDSEMQFSKSDPELKYYVYLAKLFAKYERIIHGQGNNKEFNVLIHGTMQMNLFPEYIPLNVISVLPNKQNYIIVRTKRYALTPVDAEAALPAKIGKRHGSYFKEHILEWVLIICRCMHSMEPNILKHAQAVVEKKKGGEKAVGLEPIRIADN